MAVPPRDEELVAAALRGDERAFQALVERHFGLVFLVGFSRLGDREMAEDLAQEVFLRAHLFLRQLDPPRRFPAWVSRVARNLAIDWKRRGQTASCLLSMIPLEDAMERVPDMRSADPREQSAGAQEREIIRHAILDLPPAQREVVLLHHCEDLSQPEIARRLGVSQSSVSRRLSAARARLQRALDPVLRETISALRPSRSAVAKASMIAVASAGLSTAARASLVAAAGGSVAGKAAGGAKGVGAALSLSSVFANLFAGAKAMGAAKGIAAAAVAVAAIGGGAILMQGEDNRANDAPPVSASGEMGGLAARFVQAYSLAPGEDFKFVPAPFIEERLTAYRVANPAQAEAIPEGPDLMIINDEGVTPRHWLMHFSASGGMGLETLLGHLFSMTPDMIEGDMLDTVVRGDFVRRGNLTWDRDHAEIERVLREEAGLPVHLNLRVVPCERTVASGFFELHRLPGSRSDIEVFASRTSANSWISTEMSSVGRDDLIGILSSRLRIQIIDEITGPMPQGLSMAVFSDVEPGTAAPVLANVAEQTGYRFTTETREVPVLFVERAEDGAVVAASDQGTGVIGLGETLRRGDVTLRLDSLVDRVATFQLEAARGDGDPSRIRLSILEGETGEVAIQSAPPIPDIPDQRWAITVHRIIEGTRVEVEIQ
jgi:RNA polymerase sigma factor CnrH